MNVWDPILALARVFIQQILGKCLYLPVCARKMSTNTHKHSIFASIGHVFVPLLTLIVPYTLELLPSWAIYIIGRPNIELYITEILPKDEIFHVQSTYRAYIGSGGAI